MATLDDLFNVDGSEKAPGGAPATGPVARGAETYGAEGRRSAPPAGGLKTLKVPPTGEAMGLSGYLMVGAQEPASTTHPLTPAGSPIAQHPDPTIEELLAGPFTYLSGPAGTGKTFLARSILQTREDAVLTSTTGVSAVNMGDATTINALLGYFDTASLMTSFASGFLSTRLRRLRKSGIRTIVLDECSMLSADQLTILCQALDDVNLKKSYDASLEETTYTAEEEFEMRLLLVGDFAQLPVVEEPFAFESPEWHRFAARTFTLRNIRRQGDRAFIEALQAVRRGDPRAAVGTLAPCFAPTIDFDFPGTTIVAKNDEVDRINLIRHARLPGELLTWKTVRSGEQQKDWLRLIPEAVEVKVGALVMVLANKSLGWDPDSHMPLGYAYVNGDLGVVEGRDEDRGVSIHLLRTATSVTVTPLTSEWREPTGKKTPAYEVKGAVTRMPLRLAYASTVHKCVTGDTLVPVLGLGYVPAADLRAGNITPYGEIKAVAETRQLAYRVTTAKGYTVVCSGAHRWMTRQGLKETTQLSIEDRIELNHGIPFPGAPILTYDQAWTLGAIVGDGCYTDRDDGTMELACSHGGFGELFRLRAEKAWGVHPQWRKDRRGLNWTKKAFREQLEEWGLGYVKAPCKQIPWVVWRLGPIERGAFLSGLFDTDGHIGRQRIVLTTASEQLGQQVQEMLLTLGIVSKRSSYPGVQDSIYYQVYVAAECRDRFLQWVGFSHSEKGERAKLHRPNRALRPALGYDRVAWVEPVGLDLPMYDLEIPRPHMIPFGPFLGHNSQGLSLDQVQVSISNWMFNKGGMLYVALSRARTLHGLRIVGSEKMFGNRCKVDKRVEMWL